MATAERSEAQAYDGGGAQPVDVGRTLLTKILGVPVVAWISVALACACVSGALLRSAAARACCAEEGGEEDAVISAGLAAEQMHRNAAAYAEADKARWLSVLHRDAARSANGDDFWA